jgi:tetrahydromethanopterin S-methyltransferase subunit D
MKISPSHILTFLLLAMATALSMPVHPKIVLGGGNFDTELIKSRELNVSTGTNSVQLEERQGAVGLIVIEVAAAVMTAIQTFVLLFNDDAVSSNLMLFVL